MGYLWKEPKKRKRSTLVDLGKNKCEKQRFKGIKWSIHIESEAGE